MSVAASAENQAQPLYARYSLSFWKRAVIIAGLILADLVSFAVADLVIRLLYTPPTFAFFYAQRSGQAIYLDAIGVIAIVFVLARYLVGDYSRRQPFWDGARATTSALMICGVPYLAGLAIFGQDGLVLSAFAWFVLLFLLPGMRQLARHIMGKLGLWYLPSAMLGVSAAAQEVYFGVNGQLSLGMRIEWLVPDSYYDTPIPSTLANLKQINAAPEDLVSVLSASGCRQVIWVPDDRMPLVQNDLIDQFIGADIRVAIVPSLRRLPMFGLSASSFFGKDMLLLQVRNNLSRLPQRVLKRFLDVAGSLMALVFLSPVFLLMAWLIKREDGGPVFFIQNRVGRGGSDFGCWKFRSMVTDAEMQMSRWFEENPELAQQYRASNFKLAQDPRLTRIGAWMRRKSIDELPQLFNVLLGHMSLVGPRPLLRRELPDYGTAFSLYERVRPGITGMWQVSGRSHTTFAERVSYDEWYIKNWTVWYDIVIALQTVRVLLRGEGAY